MRSLSVVATFVVALPAALPFGGGVSSHEARRSTTFLAPLRDGGVVTSVSSALTGEKIGPFGGRRGRPHSKLSTYHQGPPSSSPTGNRGGPLHALVYGPDGTIEENTDDAPLPRGRVGDRRPLFDPPPTTTTSSGGDGDGGVFDVMAAQLSSQRVKTLLAIMVANAPSSMGLTLDQTREARVVSLDGGSMSIEAIVSDVTDATCTATLVSVDFPRPCDGTKKAWLVKGCVMENVDALEREAKAKIGQMEKSSSSASFLDGIEGKDEVLRELYGDVDTYPSWWVPLTSVSAGGIADECDNIQGLLDGDDFRGEVDAMVRYGLDLREKEQVPQEWEQDADESGAPPATSSFDTILRAHVVAVGPAGVVLKALMTSAESKSAASASVVEVPVPFGEVVAEKGGIGAALDSMFSKAFAAAKARDAAAAQAAVESKARAEEEARVKAEKEAEAMAKVAAVEQAKAALGVDVKARAAEAEAAAEAKTTTEKKSDAITEDRSIEDRRRQPKSAEEEAALAARYEAMGSLEDRAFAILLDLGMVLRSPDPANADYDDSGDDEAAPGQSVVLERMRR